MRWLILPVVVLLLSSLALAGPADEGYHNTLYAHTIQSPTYGQINVYGVLNGGTIRATNFDASSSVSAWSLRGSYGVWAGNSFFGSGSLVVPNLMGSSSSGMADVQFNGNNIVQRTSSAKYKDDIRDLDIPTETVLRLRPREFVDIRTGHDSVGLIAEEVHETGLTSLVYYKDGAPESVSYSELAVYLIPVIKEQQARIDALEARLALLEQQ